MIRKIALTLIAFLIVLRAEAQPNVAAANTSSLPERQTQRHPAPLQNTAKTTAKFSPGPNFASSNTTVEVQNPRAGNGETLLSSALQRQEQVVDGSYYQLIVTAYGPRCTDSLTGKPDQQWIQRVQKGLE